MRHLRVGTVLELPPGRALRVCEPGVGPIAVFNVGGRYRAIDDTCTHGKASLSAEGRVLADDVIECGWHRGRFSLAIGKAVRFPAMVGLRAYRVIVEDDVVFVE